MWRLLAIFLLLPCLAWGQMITPPPPYRVNTAHPLFKGLQAWWAMMPGRVGGLQLWDMARHNHGTLNGGAAYTIDSAGKFGGAIAYDGVDDYVTLGNIFAFERTDAFSLVVNFKASGQNNKCLLCKADTGTSNAGYYFKIGIGGSLNSISWTILDAANCLQLHTTNAAFTDGTEHQAVVTYAGTNDESGMAIAIDGGFIATTSDCGGTLSSSIVTTAALYVGNDVSLTRAYTGDISMAMIYNRVLSASEVSQLVQLQAPLYGGLVIDTTALPDRPVARKVGTQ